MVTPASFWDDIAEKYARDPIRDMDGYTYTLERTRSYLAQDMSALEIGCGTGSTALLLAASVERFAATDISGAMIAIAREKARKEGAGDIAFQVAPADADIDGGPFDAILSHNLLHLVPNLDETLDRVAKMTKKGGVFISKTPVRPRGFDLKFAAITLAIPLMRLFGKAPYVRFFTSAEYDRMLAQRGFKVVETWEQPGTLTAHYVVARKEA